MSRRPEFAEPPRGKPEIAVATTCRHCKKKFYGPRTVLVIGETPGARFMKYLHDINMHIVEKHPKQFDIAQTLGAELQGMLMLMNYESADPEVIDQQNYYRWKVHQSTLKARVSDEAIEGKAQETVDTIFKERTLDIRSVMKAEFVKQLKELRDILQEPGAYSEPDPAGPASGQVIDLKTTQ